MFKPGLVRVLSTREITQLRGASLPRRALLSWVGYLIWRRQRRCRGRVWYCSPAQFVSQTPTKGLLLFPSLMGSQGHK